MKLFRITILFMLITASITYPPCLQAEAIISIYSIENLRKEGEAKTFDELLDLRSELEDQVLKLEDDHLSPKYIDHIPISLIAGLYNYDKEKVIETLNLFRAILNDFADKRGLDKPYEKPEYKFENRYNAYRKLLTSSLRLSLDKKDYTFFEHVVKKFNDSPYVYIRRIFALKIQRYVTDIDYKLPYGDFYQLIRYMKSREVDYLCQANQNDFSDFIVKRADSVSIIYHLYYSMEHVAKELLGEI